MIIKSSQKKLNYNFEIKMPNKDGSQYILEKKNYIKYLGVLIDNTISWKYHISHIRSKISKNTEIFLKLRHYLSLKQLKQLYYNLIYPYLSYAIIAWGSASTSYLEKIQTKQNHIMRVIFFATLYGKNTNTAFPLHNLLDLLSVENIFTLQLLTFSHKWHKKQLPNLFDNNLLYASEVHHYNTRYTAKANFYKAHFRTNIGRKTTSALAADLWQQIPKQMKTSNTFLFPKQIKKYPLLKQMNCPNPVAFV